MKGLKKITACVLLAASFVAPAVAMRTGNREVVAAADTGYTKASDVKYVTSGQYVANWGARDEDCVFLSKYAESFYTGSYVYETLSKQNGGAGFSNAHQSQLYSSLQSLMKAKHKNETSYGATRYLYCYTDCLQSNYNQISSFYSAKTVSGTWDGGKTWNREHTWPNSKGDLSGNGENDIMMLRPASVSENSSRGNKAYGESSGYYDPNGEGQSVRGDCARIVLYQYVRWGAINTGSYNSKDIFGTGGVIESLNILLKWMAEDPVDTWEMGRNDAVQSITGTRNVFVDYPEYAWLLFGEDVPENIVTPSGKAKDNLPTEDSSMEEDSSIVEDSSFKEDSSTQEDSSNNTSEEVEVCEHSFSKWIEMKPATETEEGERGRMCTKCGHTEKETIPALCQHEFSKWIITKPATETEDGEQRRMCTKCGHMEKETIPMLSSEQPIVPNGEGCSSSVGATMGCIWLALASCVLLDKMHKRKNE